MRALDALHLSSNLRFSSSHPSRLKRFSGKDPPVGPGDLILRQFPFQPSVSKQLIAASRGLCPA